MARKSRKRRTPEAAPAPGMRMWRAALYIRLSVEFNGNHGDSLETQKGIMEAYLALCPDIEVERVYTDNGASGRTFERLAFQAMLEDIEDGKIDCVVVKDLSRLGRNTIDTGYYIEKYFPLHRVRFIAVNDQFDSEHSDNTGSHLIMPLKNMINEAYAADISRKVRSQQRQAMRDGEFVGSRPPYGYRKDPENCHRLLVNEDTAPAVRRIFQWAAEGISLNVIVKRLNEAGILTPGRYLASVGLITDQRLMGSGHWQSWTVGKMLADEVYTGDMVQGRTTTVGHRQVPTPPEDWIVVRGTHEPLVSRELFERVQTVRKRAAPTAEKIPYTENILRGRIFCGLCGKPLHRQRSHGRNYFYRCISNDRIGKDACPGKVSVRETDLFEIILTFLHNEAQIDLVDGMRSKLDGKLAARRAEADREIARLRRETSDNRRYLTSLYENMVTGVLTAAEYRELKAGYEQKIAEAVERTKVLFEQQKDLERQRKNCFDMLDAAREGAALDPLLVDKVIERVTVSGPEEVSIQFKFRDSFDRLREVMAGE